MRLLLTCIEAESKWYNLGLQWIYRLRTRGVRGIDLESIGAQAEGIFGTCEESEVLDLDGNGGKTFLRVLLHLGMHDYPPLVSGALRLLFRHFSQRQEVLQAFKQVLYMHIYIYTGVKEEGIIQTCHFYYINYFSRFNFWSATKTSNTTSKLKMI